MRRSTEGPGPAKSGSRRPAHWIRVWKSKANPERRETKRGQRKRWLASGEGGKPRERTKTAGAHVGGWMHITQRGVGFSIVIVVCSLQQSSHRERRGLLVWSEVAILLPWNTPNQYQLGSYDLCDQLSH